MLNLFQHHIILIVDNKIETLKQVQGEVFNFNEL